MGVWGRLVSDLYEIWGDIMFLHTIFIKDYNQWCWDEGTEESKKKQ